MMKGIYFPNVLLQRYPKFSTIQQNDSTQEWYILLLVFKVKILSLKSVFFKLWTPFSDMHTHKPPHSTDIDCLSLSAVTLPKTICM